MAITTNLKPIVSIYDKYFRKCYNNMLNRYGSFLKAAAYCDVVMAEVLLIGNHQARHNDLISWRPEVCKAIQKLAAAKPWKKKYASFADIYNEVKIILSGCKYMGELTIYDVALRLAAQYPIPSRMPDKVYLNAGPWEAAKKLYKAGILKKLAHIMNKTDFPAAFHILRCDEIEDLLCVMEHYGVFTSLINLEKVKPTHVCGSFFRKNLLAHILLEENWGKDPIPCDQLTTLCN